jgi:DNA-binding NtrC family response regulator
MEIEASTGDSAYHTGTKALAGLRVLLISADSGVRKEVEEVCRWLGLRPDTVHNSRQAVQSIERDQPHMIIVDERVRDKIFNDLMQDIRRLDPNFGFLEIADAANTFEISSWMSDSMTRVSRDVLRAHLPSILTLELAKAF